MASNQSAMRNLMIRIGYSAESANILYAEGFASVEAYRTLTRDAIISMHRRLTATHQNVPNVSFTEVAGMNLYALAYWATEQVRLGLIPIIPASFTVATLQAVIQQIMDVDDARTFEKDRTPMRPQKLKTVQDWDVFYNMFCTYLSQIRGAAKCPLSYVIRKETEITLEARNSAYNSNDERLIALTPHTGTHYSTDNRQVYVYLKELTIGHDCWTFVRRFDIAMSDGRGALEALRTQCEGNATNLSKKHKAYHALASAKYTGERKRNAFNEYIKIHMDNFEILMALGEPISEAKRVTDFLNNMTCGIMHGAKTYIIGNENLLNNFNEMQMYCTTYLAMNASTATTSTPSRRISAQTSANGRDYKKMYPAKEWFSFSQAERDEMTRLREADPDMKKKKQQKKSKKDKKKFTKSTGVKRQASAAASTPASDDEDNSDETTSPNTSQQYGRARNKSAKKAKADE